MKERKKRKRKIKGKRKEKEKSSEVASDQVGGSADALGPELLTAGRAVPGAAPALLQAWQCPPRPAQRQHGLAVSKASTEVRRQRPREVRGWAGSTSTQD